MVDREIIAAIVDLAIFLEDSDDDVLDPDAAVQAMEQLASNLQSAREGTRIALVSEFKAMATAYGDQAEFVASLGDTLGLG